MEPRTINDFLGENLKRQKQTRLERLIELTAPQVIIDTVKAEIEGDSGLSKVGKIENFGSVEFVDFETQKYRRGDGVNFITETGRVIKLIPGPHGYFLVEDKDE